MISHTFHFESKLFPAIFQTRWGAWIQNEMHLVRASVVVGLREWTQAGPPEEDSGKSRASRGAHHTYGQLGQPGPVQSTDAGEVRCQLNQGPRFQTGGASLKTKENIKANVYNPPSSPAPSERDSPVPLEGKEILLSADPRQASGI